MPKKISRNPSQNAALSTAIDQSSEGLPVASAQSSVRVVLPCGLDYASSFGRVFVHYSSEADYQAALARGEVGANGEYVVPSNDNR